MQDPMPSAAASSRAGEAQDERLVGVEGGVVVAPIADRLDLRVGGADGAGDRVVLNPLVLGADAACDLQDRELAQQRIELELAQQRAAVAEPRPVGALRMSDHPKQLEGRRIMAGRGLGKREARHACVAYAPPGSRSP